jgi:cytochrome c-type biogenesis protein CcmE
MPFMSQALSSQDKKGIRWGWIVGGLLVAFLVIAFALKAIEGMVTYYVTADEFVKNREDYLGKKVKVAGRAQQVKFENGIYQFDVVLNDLRFPVTYSGLAPDTFKEDVEVVVEGRARQEDPFEATVLMAKCASKYEAGGLPPLQEMRKDGY